MNKDMTLVILAAGMGSRFNGLKQITPFGPNGEFIIDYSIYDAIKAGFTKVVFIIKEENFEVFKSTIGNRVEKHIKVEYCFQKNDNIDSKYQNLLKDRVKPIGTSHAILCCKDKVHEPFMTINADDFYGRDAFMQGAEFLKNKKENLYGLVGYLVENTIMSSGGVKRGICEIENDNLIKLIESFVERKNDSIIAKPLDGSKEFTIKKDQIAAMNLFLLDPSIFKYIEKKLPEYLDSHIDTIDTCEYLISDTIFNAIEENYAKTKVIKTTSSWYGITYKEDVDNVKKGIKNLIDSKVYPVKLWD